MNNQHIGLAKAYNSYFIVSITCALLGTSAQAEPLAYALRPQTNLISVIDTRKDSVVRDIDGHFTQVRRISVAPDGKRIYIADQGKDFVSVINAETGSQTKIAFPGRRVLSVTTAPDSRNIYVMTDNGASPIFEVVDAVSGKVTSTFSASLANTGACVVSPNSQRMYCLADGTLVFEFDLTNSGRLSRIQLPRIPSYNMALSPDGKRGYVSLVFGDPYTIMVIDLTSKAEIARIPSDRWVGPITVSPDGRRAYGVSNSAVLIVDTTTNSIVGSIPVPTTTSNLVITPDGEKAYIGGVESVSVIDLRRDRLVGAIPLRASNLGIAPAPQGLPFYLFNADLDLDRKRRKLSLQTNFTLSSFGNGVNPLSEQVQIMVGSFLATIPAGSFEQRGNKFMFQGKINKASVRVKIKAFDSLHYALDAAVDNPDLAAGRGVIPVSVSIGNDAGRLSLREGACLRDER